MKKAIKFLLLPIAFAISLSYYFMFSRRRQIAPKEVLETEKKIDKDVKNESISDIIHNLNDWLNS